MHVLCITTMGLFACEGREGTPSLVDDENMHICVDAAGHCIRYDREYK